MNAEDRIANSKNYKGGIDIVKMHEDGRVLKYRIFRIRHHITLRELSEQAGVSQQWISQIELMECHPTTQTKVKLIVAMRNTLLQRGELAAAALLDFQNIRHQLFESGMESEALSDE